ncbi:MAG: hypothetical protein M0Z59_08505 [Nitrospiraceae bacterium]|nr:hypothetical protein [Nitrospiraceae bacterium]
MGLSDAKKYISELRKKQNDPYCWPDYLTGLPGKSAILKQIDKVYPKLGRWGIAYIRVSNIYPFLMKYGYENHAELIEWAAAILKTSTDRVKDAFIGTLDTHDYILIARPGDIDRVLEDASKLFAKKTRAFYSPEDRNEGVVLSFQMEGRDVCVGLMDFIHSSVREKTSVPKAELLAYLAGLCSRLESKAI